ncbi:MAG: ABC transporter ATP-binding protein [Paracoccaceae bacterium]
MSDDIMISIANVGRRYGSFVALENIDLKIRAGEFFSLLGPSGCGKTTLLRLIGGFDDPSSGSVSIDGLEMAGVPANRRPTNMVFQSYAIFPHLNVAENVAFGLNILNLTKAEKQSRVDEALARVRLEGLGSRMGSQLSGGQRQRVALARALVMKPKVLLLDEPLSALDKKLREEMQVELRQLQQDIGITFVLVTHDQYEALAMSDRIAVMFDGKIAQTADPQEIYQNPTSRRVADFLGGMNFLEATNMRLLGEDVVADVAGFGTISKKTRNDQVIDPANSTLGIRPERLRILWDDDKAKNEIAGKVLSRHYFGEVTNLMVQINGQPQPLSLVETNDFGADGIPVGSYVRIAYDDDAFVVMKD